MRARIILIILLFISQTLWAHDGHRDHLIYIENKGQWDSKILYKTDIKNGAIFLENNKLTINVTENKSHRFNPERLNEPCKGHAYSIEFLESNPQSIKLGEEKTTEYFNYFLGSDAKKWRGGCAGYEEIIYKELYPNIDLKINSSNFQPKYTFILRKGAKLNDIKLKFVGLNQLYINPKGDLISMTSLGEVKDEKPISYLYNEGQRKEISSNFLLTDSIVSFQLEMDELKEDQVLEIDPQIIFSTYSGSTADNFGASATYDYAGNLYGTGLVFGTGYPTTTGAYQSTFGGSSDIGITKFNPTGSARVYSTYIGGSSYDVPHSLVVDQNNRLILLSTTSSSNFPTTTGAFRNNFSGGPTLNGIASLNGLGILYPNGADIAITKFNPTGTGLVGSTYYGGSGTDGVGISTDLVKNYGDGIRGEIETDSFGNIYIASLSNSNNLPSVANSFKSTNSGGFDGILAKFNTNLTSLLGFSYIGGSGDDALYDLCFDDVGNIIAAGGTASSNIGTTSGVVNSSYGGNTDGMVVSLNNILSTLRFSSYYGTSDYDQVYFVETDRANKIFVFGQTNHSSTNFYLVSSTFSNPHKGQFISIFNPLMTTKLRSTTFGAGNQNPDISPTAFLVDYCDKIFITGWGSNLGTFNTFSLTTTGLPITSNAFQSSTLGNGFYMMILEGDLSALYYGSFFGGTTSLSEEHVDGGTSRFDKNGIVYHAVCAGCGGQQNFPIFPNASSVVSGTNNSSNCNLGVFKFDFGLPVSADFTYNPSCAPANVLFTNLSHTVSSGSQFRWSFSNGATSTLKDPIINFSSSGVYTARLIIIDSTSCNIADTMTKSILILGTTADTLTDKVICPGSSVKIGFSGIIDTGLTLRWSPTNSLDDTTILSPFASPTITTKYRLILSKTGCTDTFYQTVIVETPKPLVIRGDSITCTGVINTYTCNAYAGGSYDWLPKNILTSSNRDTARFNFTSLPATISVSYTSPNGCLSSTNKLIIQGTPTLKLSADSIVCKGDIVTIIRNININGGTYSYNPTAALLYASGDTIKVKVDSSMVFKVVYTLSANCTARDSISFKLLKDKINWSLDSILCFNQNVVASATLNPSYSINWQPSATLITPQGNSPAQFNLSNVNRYVYIQVSHNLKSYCLFNDSALVKFINPMVKLRADTTKCKDSTVTIYHGNTKGTNKIWSPSNLLISQTDSSATFRVSQTQYYKLTINDNSCSLSDSIRIRVVNDYVKITGDTVVCPKDTAALQVNSMTGASYTWLPGPLVISGLGTPSVLVRVNSPQWFFIHVQDTNNCYIIDSFFVNNFDSTKSAKADFISNTNCQNLTINFTNLSREVSTSPSYIWNFGGQGTSTLKNPNFTFSNYGLQNVTLIIQDAGSCNLSDTIAQSIYILNNKKTLLPDLKSCKGDTVSIGLRGMVDNLATINWTPSTGLVNANTFNPKIRLFTSTTFTGIISKNGCVDTLVQKVDIDSPNAIKLRGDTLACLNSDLLYTTDKYTVGSYQWFPFNNIVYQNRDSARMMITTNNLWIKVLYISDFGCQTKDSLQIKTIPTTLNLQMDSIGCKSEVLSIKYRGLPKGGIFSFSPSTNILSFNDTSAQYNLDTSRLFLINYKINNSCLAGQSMKINLLKDAINWKADTITCRNNTILASANTNNRWSLIWSPTTLLQTIQGNSPARFGNFANDNKIYIQSTLFNRPNCTFNDSANIRLFENLIKITGKNSNCADSFIQLSATLIPNTSYTWSPNNALFNANQNLAIFKTDISRYYYVSARFNNQCTAVDSHYVKTGNSALKLSADSIICLNDTVTLLATSLPNATYLWSNGATTNATIVNVPQTTTYYLQVVDSNNCKLKDSIRVKTFDKSNMKFITTDNIVCKFDTVILEVSQYPNVRYTWSPSSFILSGNGTYKIKAWINQTTKFYFDAFLNRGVGCQIIDSITMVKDTQFLKISGNQLVCKGDTLILQATPNPTFTYNWKPTNWISNSGRTTQYKIIDSILVICEAQSSTFVKCKYRDSVKADYSRELDDLRVTATPSRIEYGSTSILNANADNIVQYLWSPSTTLSNKYVPSPTAKPDTTTTYYVTVRNPLGCRGDDSVVVTVYYEDCADPEVFLPTGFTPNKDGKNDALYVRGDNITKMYLAIYDRWGQLIFESDNQKKGWDGTYKGIELEPTVYAYYLYVECIGGAKYSKKGNITLIK